MRSKHSFLILAFIVSIFSFSCSIGIISAAFAPPKLLTQYIPGGFVVDEKYSGTQNVGMFTSTAIVARKENQLPKPFVSPEFSDFGVGYVESSNPAYSAPMWQEAQQKAEAESKAQTNPERLFIEKEPIRGGGAIYWYKGVHFNAQGAKGEASEIIIYAATIIKQGGKGVLTIKITDFVGDREIIRKCFR